MIFILEEKLIEHLKWVKLNNLKYRIIGAGSNLLIKNTFKEQGKIEVSRFKGLGEMPPSQLKETAMNPETRTLLRIVLPKNNSGMAEMDTQDTIELVDQLMGRKPEYRLAFIQKHAANVEDELIDL